MPLSLTRAVICALAFVCAALAAGQDYAPISAANLGLLHSHGRIDFAEFPGEPKIGWFEADADASEFILFDQAGRIYRAAPAGIEDSWSYVETGSGQLFSLIDAAYIADEAQVLYVLDGDYFINERRLPAGREPVAIFPFGDSLIVEALDANGRTLFMQFADAKETDAWQLVGESPVPATDPQTPAVRIGRIDFPIVLYSALEDGALEVYRYPDAFEASLVTEYNLPQGPAVFGAVNGATGSHFAWSDPASTRLNLLNLETGESRVVAEIGHAYAQYHMLAADASAILVVNLDFAPEVFAWDVDTGERHELGAYRECERIPDKVALSANGTALVIGCDTGLDIWRVSENAESEES